MWLKYKILSEGSKSQTRVKNKDVVLKYYFGKSEGHSYEKYSSKRLKVSDIKCRVLIYLHLL